MGGGGRQGGGLDGAGDLLAVLEQRLLLDLAGQLEHGVEEHLGARRAARQVDVHRDDVVAPLDDGVVVEDSARGGAGAHGDDPLRLGHGVVDVAHDRGHLVGDAARDDHDVGVARGGAEDLPAEAGHVEAGRAGGHHLDGAAGQAHGDGPHGAGLGEARELLNGGQQEAGAVHLGGSGRVGVVALGRNGRHEGVVLFHALHCCVLLEIVRAACRPQGPSLVPRTRSVCLSPSPVRLGATRECRAR